MDPNLGMGEKIVLAPGANAAELAKSLAKYGKNSFNMRIVGTAELAHIILMRSGKTVEEEFVSIREEAAKYAGLIKDEEYFGRATYSDLKKIAGAVRKMRLMIAGGNEAEILHENMAKGTFRQKNEALARVYDKYMRYLKNNSLTDTVSLIRRALNEGAPFEADFITLKEYPLKPLETALLQMASGGRAQQKTVAELFGAGENGEGKNKIKLESIKRCYGASNEAESILTDIYANRKLDTCTVAVTDAATYGQLLFDRALLYDLPITFGCGIPVLNSNPAKLLALYHHWMTDGFFGPAALFGMLSANVFNRSRLVEERGELPEDLWENSFEKVLGSLRLTNDREKNKKIIEAFKQNIKEQEEIAETFAERDRSALLTKKLCVPYLEVYARELALPTEDFIAKYAYLRKNPSSNAGKVLMTLDKAALGAIHDELVLIKASGADMAEDDIIRNVLSVAVSSGESEEGKIFVTDIRGAFSTVRENLYIAGLSANLYPGAAREDYLLLDEDIRLFGNDDAASAAAERETAEGKVRAAQEALFDVTRLYAGLGSKVNISYSGLNVSELKKNNASSLVFELFKEEHGDTATTKELEKNTVNVDYFEPEISATRKIGDAYNNKIKILQETAEKPQQLQVKLDLSREYSASTLETFFTCPKKFMFSNVLGIKEPDEEDPFEIISAKDSGTLAHSLMEQLREDTTLQEFLALSGEYFDRFAAEHTPLVKPGIAEEKVSFLEMMETAYGMADRTAEVVLKEAQIKGEHESGVKLIGYPDRVEKRADGTYHIIDYKAGFKVKHVQDDIDTCLQAVLYAYLMEQRGITASDGEYVYLRKGEKVSCRYDEEMKQKLKEKLEFFREHLENADFPAYEEKTEEDGKTTESPCKYCKFGEICGNGPEGEDDEYDE